MTTVIHEIVRCSCGTVIKQCRCMKADKPVTIVADGCDQCALKIIAEVNAR